ncbi:MAG: hypothetical protein MRJ66_17535 [Nitrospira sp.]|nr:hypothetical protein [Nitrospira sp.]
MEQVPRQPYTKEFREQTVRLVLEQQVTIPKAARRLTLRRSIAPRQDKSSNIWYMN